VLQVQPHADDVADHRASFAGEAEPETTFPAADGADAIWPAILNVEHGKIQ
jgi:hypothetical protein